MFAKMKRMFFTINCTFKTFWPFIRMLQINRQKDVAYSLDNVVNDFHFHRLRKLDLSVFEKNQFGCWCFCLSVDEWKENLFNCSYRSWFYWLLFFCETLNGCLMSQSAWLGDLWPSGRERWDRDQRIVVLRSSKCSLSKYFLNNNVR